MFTTIVITLPYFIADEAECIASFIRSGQADIVHIRKPQASRDDVETLLHNIPAELHCRLTLHNHFDLAITYNLHGVHTNSRNLLTPECFKGSVSHSCHSLDEVARLKHKYDFVSLSPIFDSISKLGYMSAFTPESIIQAVASGVIDNKVFALGGVTFNLLPKVREMGFGGAMILGDAWK